MKRTRHTSVNRRLKALRPDLFRLPAIALLLIGAIYLLVNYRPTSQQPAANQKTSIDQSRRYQPTEKWMQRAYAIDELYHVVYTPCWEGAYGAIGDAYLFDATHDSSLLRFHLVEHDLRRMCTGRWVDDRAWICLAELTWWNVTGRTAASLVDDARQRYLQARSEGRLSNHQGFWSWYNWPPASTPSERIFTNSNMNQMAAVACGLYEATGDKQFLNDALLVWNGDKNSPGVERFLYKGNGRWEGKSGLAAFGKQLPWDGTEYCSIGASLFRVTKDPHIKTIVIATARRILDARTGWVDPIDFYQLHMDGNGAFVNYLLDAYMSAPDELKEIPSKVENMLEHVWSNHHGTAAVTLHRKSDHGIRNGWNPVGGEDGYGVDEVGTVHAQAEAVRAFGLFAYVSHRFLGQEVDRRTTTP